MWICLFARVSMKMLIEGGTQAILKDCMNASTPLPFSKKTVVEVERSEGGNWYRIKGHVDDFPESAQSNIQ